MDKEFEYYAILGVTSQATLEEIQTAFAALRLKIPKEKRNKAKNPAYARLANAYEVLSDPARRATYDSLLAETKSLEMVNLQVTASRDRIKVSDAEQVVYLLLDILPPTQETKQLPLNLSLVLDKSTSMQGSRLSHVKTAVELIVNKMAPVDTLSIVSFSDRAEVVVPAGKVENPTAVVGQLRGVQASGGTEIYQGLQAGVKELQKVDLAKHTNYLILLTDGHTYGDAAQCLELAQRTAKENIGISAFGLGTEWNDQFLDALVSPSGGQSNFVEQPGDIVQHLQKRIQGLGTIYAKNLQLKAALHRNVSIQYGFKLEPFAQPIAVDEEMLQLGNLEGRSPLAALLELKIAPSPAETRLNLNIEIIADIPGPQMHEQTFKDSHRLLVLSDVAQEMPPEKIVEAVRVMNMYRMNEKVWQEVEAGRLDVATTRMHHLSTRLLEAGETELAHQAQQEMEQISRAGTMSLAGRKKLKYGTRALIDKAQYKKKHD
ncbi:VWA domain-containing protein [Candidatus Leptofilum sp.]|uniref:VWA domain-containing protein n=1 Tax=Candidatus Leptofilum sp. TaxID=3241576 RepID=UPI003B58EBD8